MLALALLAAAAPGAAAQEPPRVVIAVLPHVESVEDIASVSELAPGLVSAGLGAVPESQTFLDVGQGNRVDETLYDGDLPPLHVRDGAVPPPLWERTLERAEAAPANIVPGLLASTLADAGIAVAAEPDGGPPALIAVDRDGLVPSPGARPCIPECGPGLSLVRARLAALPGLAAGLGPEDLLIAIAAESSDEELLPVGIGGEGFDGNLTSDSTRTDGIVTTTDIAPTVLEHLDIDVPDEMNGSEITSGDERDPEAIGDLQDRLDTRPNRLPAALVPLAAWLALCGLAAAAWRGAGARVALRLLALACAWAPSLFLVVAAIDADTAAAALLVGIGSVALGAATHLLLPGYAGLALACAVTVTAHAVDVVAGSPLTALSVLGPNPDFGVRFFGIGNELEAVLTTLTLIGTGAALSAAATADRRRAAAWFAGVALVAAAAFAPGRFGADVGAAIVLGVGGATAAVLALGLDRRRAIAVVVGGGVLALAALLLVDLVLGGAHLSRTVLGAGEAGDVLDVFERRLTLMADTFIHPVYPGLLAVSALLLVAGFIRRRAVLSWFGDAWPARSGFLGALAGVLVGSVANDSGSVLLVIGTIYLAATAGFAWAAGPASTPGADPP
jgi:hypothetical protein